VFYILRYRSGRQGKGSVQEDKSVQEDGHFVILSGMQ